MKPGSDITNSLSPVIQKELLMPKGNRNQTRKTLFTNSEEFINPQIEKEFIIRKIDETVKKIAKTR